MIDSLCGDVLRKTEDSVVVDTGGVAYRASCSAVTLRALDVGHSAVVFIHLLVREDTIELFGFADESERDVFRKLLTVSQVGPRVALQILSVIPPEKLAEVIAARDADLLMSVKGVGRKTAERILVDLRDKIVDSGRRAGSLFLSPAEEIALRALTSRSLGFSVREARDALSRLRGEGLAAEDLVRRALEILGGGT
ncbi:MAG: Holliday junction branch migration protein RuvA [Candidatus Bipolaricaulota bacterium]